MYARVNSDRQVSVRCTRRRLCACDLLLIAADIQPNPKKLLILPYVVVAIDAVKVREKSNIREQADAENAAGSYSLPFMTEQLLLR